MTLLGETEEKHYGRGYVWRDNVTNLYDTVIEILKAHRCGSLTIETNADKGLSKMEFGKRWPDVRGKNETENKHIRIMTFAVRAFPDIVWHKDTDINYMAQVLDYREGQDPDDAPDSMAGCVREKEWYSDDVVFVGSA